MSELEKSAQEITALQLRHATLLQEADGIAYALRIAKAKHGRLLNQQALIAKLPSEILSDIFLLCQQQHPGTKIKALQIPFEVLASQVSSWWRELAIATRLLWANILVRVRPRQLTGRQLLESKLERVRTYLERSDSCLFSATFDVSASSGPFQVDEILHLMAAEATRWRRLFMSMKNPTATLEILQTLKTLNAPVLDYMSIWLAPLPLTGPPHPTENDCTELIFRGGAPSLKFVRLSGMALACLLPPLRLVETLHLTSYTLRYTSFRSLLEGIANLVNLSLHRIQVTHRPLDCPSIGLPALRALRICGDLDAEAPNPSRLIRLLSIPSLQELTLKELDVFDDQVFPTATTLALHSCPFPAGEMLRMLRAFPELTTFRLDESLPDILDLLGMPARDGSTMAEKPPWPKLHTLAITRMEAPDVQLLVDMLERRQRLESPLSRLYLDRRSRFVLGRKDKLEWVQKRVQVERHEGVYVWPVEGIEDNDEAFFWEL
ncbi:F-box domain-containing protein [Mycena chlorophos]|uniref:F-box domain-containing protein n=1 Tax=Mycena chlorophos TaxID=658473 RepID=A0A8H6TGF5_MYCCL|nr:F-box domain-containing protein [Mycena chlorophos]